MTNKQADVVVIGAGTAGLSAERSARRAGASTILIDDRFAGTTCASVGCMPSKLLIAAAKAAHGVAKASEFGVHAASVTVDGAAVMNRVRTMRDEFVRSTLSSMDEIPEGVRLKGTATFIDTNTLDVDGQQVSAKAIVIATGARSAIPPSLQGLPNILTNETVFELPDLPQSLAVVGAGPLGLELAQAFSRLGVEVTVFNKNKKIAGLKDEAVAQALLATLQHEFPLHLDVEIEAAARDGQIALSWSGGSDGTQMFSHVLVAAGRRPQLEGLKLENTGLALDDHGTPIFDRKTMQCGSTSIFLAGDCDADVPVLHEASAEGAIAGNNAANYPSVRPSKRSTALTITFTDPPAASIGGEKAEDMVVGQSDYSDQGRAKVDARNLGLVRLYADQSGRLAGAALAVPEAEHLAHLLAWSIERGQTAMELLEQPIYHPTYEEGLRAALRQICDEIQVDFATDRDRGSAPGV